VLGDHFGNGPGPESARAVATVARMDATVRIAEMKTIRARWNCTGVLLSARLEARGALRW